MLVVIKISNNVDVNDCLRLRVLIILGLQALTFPPAYV